MFEQSEGEAIARVYSPEEKVFKAVTRRNKEQEMNARDQQRTLVQRTCWADETAKAVIYSEGRAELVGSCGPFSIRRGSEEVKGMANTHEVVCQVCRVWLDIGSFALTPTYHLPHPFFL